MDAAHLPFLMLSQHTKKPCSAALQIAHVHDAHGDETSHVECACMCMMFCTHLRVFVPRRCLPSLNTPIHKGIHKGGAARSAASFMYWVWGLGSHDKFAIPKEKHM